MHISEKNKWEAIYRKWTILLNLPSVTTLCSCLKNLWNCPCMLHHFPKERNDQIDKLKAHNTTSQSFLITNHLMLLQNVWPPWNNNVAEIVEEACAKESNIFGYGIWTHHIVHVVKNGKRLAPLFNADLEIVEIAALLHDYASIKDSTLYQDHHLHGPIEAENILRRLNYPSEKIEAVKHCIATHRGSVPKERKSVEAECLANADAMTHLEQIPSLLHLAFVQQAMGIDEGTNWVRRKLERSWNKLDPQVQEMMREKHEAALKILTLSLIPQKTDCQAVYE